MDHSEQCPHCGTMTYTDGTCSDSQCDHHLQQVVEDNEGE